MSLLNSFIALSLLVLISFSLLKTIELSSCRHEMVSQGFWMATEMLLSSQDPRIGAACNSPLVVHKDDSGVFASQINGDYHFQLTTDLNSKELK